MLQQKSTPFPFVRFRISTDGGFGKEEQISRGVHTNLDQANEIEEKDWTELYVKY